MAPRSSYLCPETECGEVYQQKSSLNIHLARHYEEGVKYQCAECDEVLKWKASLVRHVRTHHWPNQTPFDCPECDAKFKREEHSKRHQQNAHNYRKENAMLEFKCDLCESMFHSKPRLFLHMYTHYDEMGFQCDNCKKFFKRKYTLRRHLFKCMRLEDM